MSMMNDDFSFLSSKNKKERSSLPNTLCVCVFFRVSKNGLYFFVCVIFSSSISFFCCFVGVVGREYPPPPPPPPLSRHNNTRACFLSSVEL